METKKCKWCNKEFKKAHWYTCKQFEKIQYCSVKCRAKKLPPPLRWSSVKCKCEYCNKNFRVRKARYDKYKARFCSMACRADARWYVRRFNDIDQWTHKTTGTGNDEEW